MAKGISISVASDTRDFLRGVKSGVLEPLEDVSDALKDVERDGETAGSALEDAMRDGQRQTENAAEEVNDLKDALRDAERNARDMGRAGKDAGDSTRDGMRRAEEGVEEFRDEAGSTAREAAASFDGSAESIGDAFQEVAANAFAGFGPAGAVAGIAAAAGIGLALSAFTAHEEAMEEAKTRAAEWAQAYIEAGTTVLDAATQAQMAQDIITDEDRWQEAQDNAREWGVSTAVAVAAMTGETWALAAANESLTQREEEAAAGALSIADSGEALSEMLQGASADARNGREALDALNAAMESGELGAATYSETLILMAQNTEGATSSVNEFGDTIYSLPDGAQIIVDAETGQASTDIENVHYQTNQLDGASATVDVNANTGAAEQTVRNAIARMQAQSVTIRAQAIVAQAVQRTP